MFQVVSPVNQYFGSHPAYSSYTMTYIRVSHRWAQGQDSDMVAEGYHMFCKCYFATMEVWRGPVPRFSSRLLLGQHAAYPASHRLVKGWIPT